MLKILTGTPIYVWPLLCYILFIGIKSLKTALVPLRVLLVLPIAFSIWSGYTIISRYRVSLPILTLWCFATLVGTCLGYWLMNRVVVRFDKEKNLVGLPGSWFMLFSLMTIFCIRYFLGMTYAMHPEWRGNLVLFAFEGIAIAISAMFIGRALSILQKHKMAPHESLT